MVSYEDLKKARPATLTELQNSWEQVGEEFEDAEVQLKLHVGGTLRDGKLAGVSIDVAEGRAMTLADHIEYGQREAESMRSSLVEFADIVEELQGRQARIEADVHDYKGMEISSSGQVTYTHPPLDADGQTDGNDVHIHEQKEVDGRDAEALFNKRVRDLVNEATDQDEAIAANLRAIARSEDDDNVGFNNTAHNIPSVAAGEEAADDAARLMELAQEGGLSESQQLELNELLRNNAENPAFGRHLVETVGTEDLLRYTGNIILLDLGGTEDVGRMQQYLGEALASATFNDLEFAKEFADQVRDIGTHPFEFGNYSPKVTTDGYQLLAPMLEHGVYGKEFLLPVAQDLTQLTAEGFPWSSHFDGYNIANLFDVNGTSYANPLNQTLTAMGHNPEAAIEYFAGDNPTLTDASGDPILGADGKPMGYTEFLLDQASDEAGVDDAMSTGSLGGISGNPLGAALEAATTGLPYDAPPETPRVAHTPEMVSIMEDTVEYVGAHPEEFGGPEATKSDMIDSFGDMTINYMEDFHRELTSETARGFPFVPDPYGNGTPLEISGQNNETNQPYMNEWLQTLGYDETTSVKVLAANESLMVAELSTATIGDHFYEIAETQGRFAGEISTGTMEAIREDAYAAAASDNAVIDAIAHGSTIGAGMGVSSIPGVGLIASTAGTELIGAGTDFIADQFRETPDETEVKVRDMQDATKQELIDAYFSPERTAALEELIRQQSPDEDNEIITNRVEQFKEQYVERVHRTG